MYLLIAIIPPSSSSSSCSLDALALAAAARELDDRIAPCVVSIRWPALLDCDFSKECGMHV